MKYSLTLLVAGAVMATAQSNLAQCGQTCVNNMISIAQTQFGCASGDVKCYCSKSEFGAWLADCANQHCTSKQDAGTTIAYALSYCQQAYGGAQAAGSQGAVGPLSNAAGSAATPNNSGAAASAGSSAAGAAASATSAGPAAASGASASATSAASSVASGASSAASAATSGASSVASAASSAVSGAVSSAVSGASSVANTATNAINGIASSVTNAVNSATTTSRTGGAAQTAAPIFGAGAAAFALAAAML